MRRTNLDKRRAVETLLNDEEWVAWSGEKIAETAGVGHSLVSEVRKQLSESESSLAAKTKDEPKLGKDGKLRKPPKPIFEDMHFEDFEQRAVLRGLRSYNTLQTRVEPMIVCGCCEVRIGQSAEPCGCDAGRIERIRLTQSGIEVAERLGEPVAG